MTRLIEGRRWYWLAALAAIGLVQATTVIATAYSVKLLFDDRLADSLGAPATVFAVLIGMALLSAGLRWLEKPMGERLAQDYVQQVRLQLFDSAVMQRRQSLGTQVVRFSSDLNALRQWLTQGLTRLCSASLLLIGTLIALILIDWRYAAAAATAGVSGAVLMLSLSQPLEQSIRRVRRSRARVANLVAELLTQPQQLIQHGRVSKERGRLSHKSRQLGQHQLQRAARTGLLHGISDLTQRCTLLGIVGITVFDLGHDRVPVSALIAALSVVGILQRPLRDLARVFEYWQAAKVALQKLAALLGGPTHTRNAEVVLKQARGQLEIQLKNTEQPPVSIAPGSRVAIIGANGSGKSTLLANLSGLQRNLVTHVRLDQHDTALLTAKSRRHHIGWCQHDAPLASGSLSKNIRYRQPGASDKSLLQAIAAAGLTEWLAHQPDGLATRIGPNQTLSSGEQARIKLARAVLNQPALLLLDEIENGLDRQGLQALEDLLADYPGTICFATHSAELASRADLVWRMERGHLQSPANAAHAENAA